METTFIYALTEPDSQDEVRYIGKADNPWKRYNQHLKEARQRRELSHKNNWIFHLLSNKLKPQLIIIEEVAEDAWELNEQMYITLFKSWGFRLTNFADGGSGGRTGKPHLEESKEAIRRAQYKKWYGGEISTYDYELWKRLTFNIKKPRKSKEKICRIVYQIDPHTNTVVAEFSSQKECGQKLGIPLHKLSEHLTQRVFWKKKSKSAKSYKHIRKTLRGFVFIYKREYNPLFDYGVRLIKDKPQNY